VEKEYLVAKAGIRAVAVAITHAPTLLGWLRWRKQMAMRLKETATATAAAPAGRVARGEARETIPFSVGPLLERRILRLEGRRESFALASWLWTAGFRILSLASSGSLARSAGTRGAGGNVHLRPVLLLSTVVALLLLFPLRMNVVVVGGGRREAPLLLSAVARERRDGQHDGREVASFRRGRRFRLASAGISLFKCASATSARRK